MWLVFGTRHGRWNKKSQQQNEYLDLAEVFLSKVRWKEEYDRDTSIAKANIDYLARRLGILERQDAHWIRVLDVQLLSLQIRSQAPSLRSTTACCCVTNESHVADRKFLSFALHVVRVSITLCIRDRSIREASLSRSMVQMQINARIQQSNRRRREESWRRC